MRKILLTSLAVFALLGTHAAKADYFVWRDVHTGLSLSFPDTWRVVSSSDPDDVLTIMPPSGRGNAECRVRAREDGRYKIFPPRYDWAIQKIDYSFDFWNRYLGEYDNYEISNVQNGAGLGCGFAGYADASYDSAVPGPYMRREALMFATLFDHTAYILECSAHEYAFADWKGLFLSIASSVDFQTSQNQIMTGHYRNFNDDQPIIFKDQAGQMAETY